MKSILLPVNPEILAHILNGDADTLIRKLFPKDYVGWVYLYCTLGVASQKKYLKMRDELKNGKVVARFWCDKVEEVAYEKEPTGVPNSYYNYFYTEELDCREFENKCCLHEFQLKNYLQPKKAGGEICGYAIHISKLEVFDKPRELSEFWNGYDLYDGGTTLKHRLTKSPQNYCYIESEN